MGRWALRLLGPAVLVVLLLTTDVRAIGDALARADLRWFAAAVGGWVAIALVKSWRWRTILASQGIVLPMGRAARWYLAGLFLGGVSPGRLGELVKVAFVRDLGHPMGRALFGSVLDRLFDLVALPAVVVAGMALHGAAFSHEIGVVGWAAVLALAGAVLLWKARRLLVVPVRVLMPESLREQARLTLDDFFAEFGRLGWRDWALHGGVTATCWVLYAAALYLLVLALDLPLEPVYTGIAVLTAALVGLLPITVSGVGTRDAVLAAFLARVGLGTADAIALSTLVLGVNVAVILVYLPAWQASARARSRAARS
ncbi:MAG: lysylphosphatidylglycerol synthase transmembrane domain-containing protein [Myxococcota bacterium]